VTLEHRQVLSFHSVCRPSSSQHLQSTVLRISTARILMRTRGDKEVVSPAILHFMRTDATPCRMPPLVSAYIVRRISTRRRLEDKWRYFRLVRASSLIASLQPCLISSHRRTLPPAHATLTVPPRTTHNGSAYIAERLACIAMRNVRYDESG